MSLVVHQPMQLARCRMPHVFFCFFAFVDAAHRRRNVKRKRGRPWRANSAKRLPSLTRPSPDPNSRAPSRHAGHNYKNMKFVLQNDTKSCAKYLLAVPSIVSITLAAIHTSIATTLGWYRASNNYIIPSSFDNMNKLHRL